jgi:hypothetical protein
MLTNAMKIPHAKACRLILSLLTTSPPKWIESFRQDPRDQDVRQTYLRFHFVYIETNTINPQGDRRGLHSALIPCSRESNIREFRK